MTKHWMMNADVGEGYEDVKIMPYLDCANIACGGHSGDELTMRNTLKLAKKYDTMPGAHPGYPDIENFGRVSMSFSDKELLRVITHQINTLAEIADKLSYPLQYVKPHGALNHDMLQNKDIFTSICASVVNANTQPVLMVPTNAGQAWQNDIASSFGLNIWWEVFADRRYEPNGLLRSRAYDDALLNNPEEIVAQIKQMISEHTITAIDGQQIDIEHAHTICVHGDHDASIIAIEQWYTQHHAN